MIGQSIEDVRRRQAVAGNLSSEVGAHALYSFHDRRDPARRLVERLNPGLLGPLADGGLNEAKLRQPLVEKS